MNENFITLQQVVEACDDLGLIRGDEGSLDVTPVVARMTGLDMSKYVLVQRFDACGWDLVRKTA